ncbi:MAG: hypothetical protein ACKV22_30740 [Bryobacteraceae bacterium]
MQIKAVLLVINALLITLVAAQTPPAPQNVDRVLRFAHTGSEQGFQEIATLIRSMTDIRKLSFEETPKGLAVSGTPGQVALAEWLFYELDQSGDRQLPWREYRISDDGTDSVRLFYLKHSRKPEQLQEVATVVRTTAEIRRLFTCNGPNAIAARGTAEQMRLAEWLVNRLDQPSAQPLRPAAVPYQMSNTGRDVVTVFYLPHVEAGQALQETAVIVRLLADMRWVFLCNATKAMTVRGSAEQIKLAEWLVNEFNQPADREGLQRDKQPHAACEYRFPGSSDDLVRVFHLARTQAPPRLQDIATRVRVGSQVRRIFTFTNGPAIALRGTSNQLAQAQRLVKEHDQ